MFLMNEQKVRKDRRKALGFSLLEILVALMVVSILAFGMLGTMGYFKRGTVMTQQKMMASQLLDRKLAEFKSNSGTDVPATVAGQLTTVVVNDPEALALLKNATMVVNGVYPDASRTDLKEVYVTLGWDYFWTNETTLCSLSGEGRACDKQESVMTVFFKE